MRPVLAYCRKVPGVTQRNIRLSCTVRQYLPDIMASLLGNGPPHSPARYGILWPGDTGHKEAPAFVAPPVLALLARFFPERTTLALEAWPIDDAAAPITLDTISTHSQVSCPLCHVQTTRVHSR